MAIAKEKDTEEQGGDDEEVADKPEVQAADDEGNVTVTLHAKDRGSRKERRQERKGNFDDAVKEAREAKEENARLRRDLEEVRARGERGLAEVRERSTGPKADPFEADIDTIRAEQELIATTLRSGTVTTEGEAQRLKKRYYELDKKEKRAWIDIAKKELHGEVSERISRTANTGGGEAAVLAAEFPEVAENPQAQAWAGRYYELLRAEGHPANMSTARMAMKASGEKYGITKSSTPQASESQRARYGAVSAQAGQRQQSGDTMRLNGTQQRLAKIAYPDLSDHEAYSKWAVMFKKAESGDSAE